MTLLSRLCRGYRGIFPLPLWNQRLKIGIGAWIKFFVVRTDSSTSFLPIWQLCLLCCYPLCCLSHLFSFSSFFNWKGFRIEYTSNTSERIASEIIVCSLCAISPWYDNFTIFVISTEAFAPSRLQQGRASDVKSYFWLHYCFSWVLCSLFFCLNFFSR